MCLERAWLKKRRELTKKAGIQKRRLYIVNAVVMNLCETNTFISKQRKRRGWNIYLQVIMKGEFIQKHIFFIPKCFIFFWHFTRKITRHLRGSGYQNTHEMLYYHIVVKTESCHKVAKWYLVSPRLYRVIIPRSHKNILIS